MTTFDDISWTRTSPQALVVVCTQPFLHVIDPNDLDSDTLDKPSKLQPLLASWPDGSLPGAMTDTQVVQANSSRLPVLRLLISAVATPTTVLDSECPKLKLPFFRLVT